MIRIIIILVLGSLHLPLDGQSHFYRKSAGESVDLRTCVQSCFQSQLGVREATNNNDGEPEKYLKSVGFGKGAAWCGAFVHWTLYQCIGDEIYQFLPTNKAFAWTPNYVKDVSRFTDNPKPGDLITIYFSSKGRVAHVGFVDAYPEGNQVVTIEGNTNQAGSREGDGVYRKYRLKKQIYRFVNVIE